MQNKSAPFSIPEFIVLLQNDPVKAYSEFVENGNYFNNNFWKEFRKVNLLELEKQHPKSSRYLEKFITLNFHAYLNDELNQAIRETIKTIEQLKPSKEELLRCLYLCIELSDKQNNWPPYTLEAIKAIKRIIQRVPLKVGGKNKRNPTKELFNATLALLRFSIDQILIAEFVDIFLWADFEFVKDTSGWVLKPKDESRQTNLYLNNLIKTDIKKAFLKKEANSLISEQKHFLKNDPFWKTNEGVAMVLTNKNVTVKSQTPGTTSLAIEDEVFEKLKSDDPAIRNEGMMWLMYYQAEQGFHLNLRTALSEVYLPNDVIDIKALLLPFNDKLQISIYDFFCITSSLVSYAHTYHGLSQLPYNSIASIKPVLFEKLKKDYPKLTDEELWKQCDSNIALYYNDWEKHLQLKPVIAFDKSDVLEMFRKVEELKKKSDEELITILDFLADSQSQLPFTPVYKIGDKYHFSFTTCLFNFNRSIYDAFVASEIFNDKNKSAEAQKKIGSDQTTREKMFLNSLQVDLKKILTQAKTVKRPENNGEFDMLGYSAEENALLVIQVKLSNTSPFTERRKAEWIKRRIEQKGIAQIKQDLEFLNSPFGLAYVAKELGLKRKIPDGVKIFPLILTDNFYGDHLSFPLGKGSKPVTVVSYFELHNLIQQRPVDERQVKWKMDKKKPIGSIVSSIEKNVFWNFVPPLIKEMKGIKSLSLDEKYRIHMKI